MYEILEEGILKEVFETLKEETKNAVGKKTNFMYETHGAEV